MNSAASRRICLITPGHISTTPRLVKEADALAEAGYQVHVISGRYFPSMEPLDLQILERVSWKCTRVTLHGNPGSISRKIKRKLSRFIMARGWTQSADIAANAHHAHIDLLARAAIKEQADLYLGHCLAGLVAAGLAAEKQNVLLGFDIEDIHGKEIEFQLTDTAECRASEILQKKWIPRCNSLTASSGAIADEYVRLYGKKCIVIHNVFPLSESPKHFPEPEPVSFARPARFYWFSQVIGPQRGLEEALAVIARMETPVELHLRGLCSDHYRSFLHSLAKRLGIKNPIIFHSLGDPAHMALLAAPYDMGLSLELRHPPNRDFCLTNKIFCYLMAGIPQWLSRTTAQDQLAQKLGSAALSASLDDPDTAAQALDTFFKTPAKVKESFRTARLLAEKQFCWDIEKGAFLNLIQRQFEPSNLSS